MEKEVLICQPVQQAVAVIPGSIQGDCSFCGTKVWVSPSGQRLIKDKGLPMVCAPCGLARLEAKPGPHEIIVMPETAQEVRIWQRRN